MEDLLRNMSDLWTEEHFQRTFVYIEVGVRKRNNEIWQNASDGHVCPMERLRMKFKYCCNDIQ